jgi:hypothetical protein
MSQDRAISQKVFRANERVDAMPKELRTCVHEFGYAIVNACVEAGVTSPGRIRQLVHEIQEGGRQPMQRMGGNTVVQQLDWLLMQAGSHNNAMRLIRFLHSHSWTLAPLQPSVSMIEASLAEVSGGNVLCTKRDKHARRLKAALTAASKSLFPHLYSTKELSE